MAIELIVDTPVLKGEKGDKGDTGSFDYTHLEEIVDEHLDNRFSDVNANLDLKVDKEEGKSLVDDEYIEKLNNLETLDKTVVEKFNDKVEQSDLEENLIQIESQLQNYIDDKLVTAGSGDMLKSIYDTDGDGVVDIAENANNADTVNNLTVETAVPAGAIFTDTTYEEVTTEKNGLMSFSDKVKLNGIQSGANYTQIIDDLDTVGTTKALSANQGKVLNDRVQSLEDLSQPTLFEGSVATGNIVLNDNMYKYRFLVFCIQNPSDPSGDKFGYGLFPVIQMDVREYPYQPCFIGNTADLHEHSTYVALLSFVNETTLNIVHQFSNVTHFYGNNHGGAIEYNVVKIIGIR